ncbi:hypothetical protein [Actinoplanes sp. NPDC051851]|uniref:hypothetical protein n=1 Tax=Actinoplanes sp. NPDC051851 TaxID=3154753 RepID=UPI0034455240
MGKDRYPIHGRRRRWFAPWRVICRCGLAAYPCTVMRTVAYRERVNAAHAWRDDERKNSGRW